MITATSRFVNTEIALMIAAGLTLVRRETMRVGRSRSFASSVVKQELRHRVLEQSQMVRVFGLQCSD